MIKRKRPRDRYLLQPPLDYNFSLGQFSFPAPAPVVEALQLHAHEKDYLPVKGLSALKKSGSGFHCQKDLVDANSDCVLVGPG